MHDLAHSATFRPASRIAAIAVSSIVATTARARALRLDGRDIIGLGIGEPDFDTPNHIKDAAVRAIAAGETKYTALDGSAAMKEAIVRKFARENGLAVSVDQVTVSAGAKQILFNAMMATLDPSDEVIIPAPFWQTYEDIVTIAGGVARIVNCTEADGFRLTAEALEAAITPQTRWLMLNSPSNPTGAAYRETDYAPLLEVLRRHPQVWLMVDDIYEHIIYDAFKMTTPAALAPDLADRILTVNGVSKAYAMTGWRLGYATGSRSLIKAMAVVQSQSTSCPSSVSQAAAIAALDGPQDGIAERRLVFQQRRDLVVDGLNSIPGLSCRRPEGAFYTFASCAGLLGRRTPQGQVIDTDTAFCAYLLEAANLAIVPGTAFGMAPYFRISYATSSALLETAIARLSVAVAVLH